MLTSKFKYKNVLIIDQNKLDAAFLRRLLLKMPNILVVTIIPSISQAVLHIKTIHAEKQPMPDIIFFDVFWEEEHFKEFFNFLSTEINFSNTSTKLIITSPVLDYYLLSNLNNYSFIYTFIQKPIVEKTLLGLFELWNLDFT